jgi:hypothetical protein
MTKPLIEVLGVYRVPITDALIQDRIENSYPADQVNTPEDRRAVEQECREFLESIVLIEALVRGYDERFKVGDFTQRRDGVPRDDWQAAYDEAFLAPDGESRIKRPTALQAPAGDLRIAFFLHLWDAGKPLVTSYGDVACPAPRDMPERLVRLVPYENVG